MTVKGINKAVKTDEPQPAPRAVAAPVAGLKKFKIMLGLGVKRYVLADQAGGKLYESGLEYPVTAEQRTELFKLRDDNSVRIFWDADVIKDQMRAVNKKSRAQRAAAGDEDARLEIERDALVDTGATSLTDSNGDAVGVAT